MGPEKVLSAFSIFLAAVSFVIGVWGQDGAMIALSAFAVLFSILSHLRCSGKVYLYSLITSITVLICTSMAISVASYDALVGGGTISAGVWNYVCAALHGAAIIPLAVMFFFTHAAMFGSSHNWVTVSGIGWLIGTGMQVPKNVMVYIMHYSELEQEIISNTTIVVVIMVNLIALIVFFFILGRVFKKNRYIITEKGLVVRS